NDPNGQTNASGHYDNSAFTVYTLPNPALGPSSLQCDSTHACALFVGADYNDFTQPHVLVPITFSDAASTTSSTSTTSTTVQSTTSSSSTSSSTTSTTAGGGNGTTTTTDPPGATTTTA